MNLKRRDWPPRRGWIYRFRRCISWQLLKRYPLREATAEPAPKPIVVVPPVVAKASKKVATNQLGFGF